MAAMMNCPYCGKLTDPKLAGCLHCGGPLKAKSPQVPGSRPSSAPGHQCPRCKSPIQDGDIICVRCGTNLLTGQQIADEQPEPVEKKSRGSWLPVLGVGLLVFLLLSAVGGLVYFITQDPVAEAKRLATTNVLKAIEILEKHTAKHKDDPRAFFLLGKLTYQAQSFDRATAAFSTVSKIDPKNSDAAFLTVLAASRLNTGDARNQQIAALRRIVETSPDNKDAWYLLGLALGASDDLAGQKEALKRAVDLDKNLAGAHRSLGITESLQGNFADARKSLEEANQQVQKDGDNAAAVGFSASLENRPEDTATWLRQAIDNGTTVGGAARTRLGMILMSEGKADEALPYLREAKSAPNPPPEAAFNFALCLQANKLDAEALSEFERIATASGARAGEAAVQMALLFLSQGNPDRAGEAIQRAAQLGSTSAKFYTVQGSVKLALNNPAEAQQAFRNAIQSDKNYAPAHLENGLLLVSRGSLKEGLEELRRYLELAGGATKVARGDELELLVNQLDQTVNQESPGTVPAEHKAEGAKS